MTLALVVIAAVWTAAYLASTAAGGDLAWDVRFAYLPAAELLIDGKSPYPAVDDPILDEQKGYVYPPQLVLALVPFTALPVEVVATIVALGMLALVAGLLWLLGVRDARCYAAAFLWMPVASGVMFSNVSIPLAFALALVWRARDRLWPPVVTLGLAVSAKLLLWPVLVWLLATGRVRAALGAVAFGSAVTIGTWAAIGFDGLAAYPDLVRRLSDLQAENSYSLVGVAVESGLDAAVGHALALLAGAALLVGCALYARSGDDPRAFTCAVAATLVASPIVWLHYLVLLLVPLAVLRPRFSAVWLLPALLWISPLPGYADGVETFVPISVATALVAALLARPRPVRVEAAVHA